jgi:hypothetical protein
VQELTARTLQQTPGPLGDKGQCRGECYPAAANFWRARSETRCTSLWLSLSESV